MQSSEAITGKHSTFTSDNLNNVLAGNKSKYLESISLTINGLQDGSTATTMANAIGLVSRATVSFSGVIGIDVSLEQIYALNQLWLNNQTYSKISAGDNQEWILSGLSLPVWNPAVELETEASFYYSAVTNADNTELSATANYMSGIPRRTTLHYTAFSKNTSGIDDTTLNNWDHTLSSTIGNVTGILMKSATIAGGSTLIERGTIQQLAVDVNGQDSVLLYEWHELPSLQNNFAGQSYNSLEDSPASIALLDNYAWLPLGREPIPQGSNIRIKAMAGVNAETATDVVVQQIPY